MKLLPLILIIVIIFLGGFFFLKQTNQFKLPKGETIIIKEGREKTQVAMKESKRDIFMTDGVKHSIPLDEILSGGVPKDGIPSIDDPKFISAKEADEFLDDDSIGLGFVWKEETRFYPYQILVWHEIVNDEIKGDPILVTYCPLCATAIAFDPHINGEATEFGVSGKLWQSNLLMYNRSKDSEKESLWAQVLGEAVLGEFTGTKLKILTSDTIRYGDWKKAYPQTKVLSRDTGTARAYGSDPYGNYYTSDSVSFGASFNDNRLHPKELVLGVEIDGKFKAYHTKAIPEGEIIDDFAGERIIIQKDNFGQIRIFVGEDKKPLVYIGAFWFSWLAVHPETELYK